MDGAVSPDDLKLTPYHDFLIEQLRDPELASLYLDGAAREGDSSYMLQALRNVVEAQGGIGKLAKRTKLSRTTLYKTLSAKGNPEVATLETILGVYDIRLSFASVAMDKRGRYRAKRKGA
ncbi:MAG: transcriptional regulator [Elusimicrobia bacterium]|nr:transcriptional regulator [Elusimicrobiota bacterium]